MAATSACPSTGNISLHRQECIRITQVVLTFKNLNPPAWQDFWRHPWRIAGFRHAPVRHYVLKRKEGIGRPWAHRPQAQLTDYLFPPFHLSRANPLLHSFNLFYSSFSTFLFSSSRTWRASRGVNSSIFSLFNSERTGSGGSKSASCGEG